MKFKNRIFLYCFSFVFSYTMVFSIQSIAFADEIYQCDGTSKQENKISERIKIALRMYQNGATVSGETRIFTGADNARLFLEQQDANVDQINFCAWSCDKKEYLTATFNKTISVLSFNYSNPSFPSANWTANFICHSKPEEKFEPAVQNRLVNFFELLSLGLNFLGCIILLFYPPKIESVSSDGFSIVEWKNEQKANLSKTKRHARKAGFLLLSIGFVIQFCIAWYSF